MRLLLEDPALAGIRKDIVTDYRSTLFSLTKLGKDETVIKIRYRSEGEDEPRVNATVYSVKLLFTNTLSVAQLSEYLLAADAGVQYDGKLPLIQALNILINSYAKTSPSLISVGSKKTFSPSTADWMSLGGGLTALRGYFSSVRAATARILINVNVSHAGFYDNVGLTQLMARFLETTRGPTQYRKLAKFLFRVKVQTNHLKEKKNKAGKVIPRIKAIVGLANKDDGYHLEHRPKVSGFGAGAKDVAFWLEKKVASSEPKATGKKKGKAPVAGPVDGRYISVFDFFKTGEFKPDIPVL